MLASFQTSVEEEMMVPLYDYLITNEFGHFVKVDNTLVSRGRRLFISSTIEFLDETRTGVKLGPITSWWIKLQDRTHYYGVSTASCSYLLSNQRPIFFPP